MTKNIIDDLIEERITLRNCKFGFKCSQNWFKLNETENQNVKFCKKCKENVYMVFKNEELAKAVQDNKCVAFDSPNKPGVVLGKVVNNEESFVIPADIRKK